MNDDVSSLEQQATNLRDQGKGLEAIEKYKQAKKLYQDSGDLVRAAGMQQMIGVCYKIEDDTEKSIAALQQAIEDYKSAGDKLGPGRVARDIGISYLNDDQLDEAEKYLTQSKELLEALPSDSATKQSVDETVARDSELGVTLAKIGLLYVKQNKLDDAKTVLAEGLKLIRQVGHPSHEVTTLMHLAAMFFAGEQYGQMLVNLEAALGVIYEHNMVERHARRLCEIWGLMAHGFAKHDNMVSAKHYAKKSLDYMSTLSDEAKNLLRKLVNADELEKML